MGKGKCPKCMVCAHSTVGARRHPNVAYTMHALYIKQKGNWRRVGWVCLSCGSVVLDNFAPWTSRDVEPKISILKSITRVDNFGIPKCETGVNDLVDRK